MLHQQGALEGERHHLDDVSATGLQVVAVAELALETIGESIETAVGAASLADLGEECREGFRLPRNGAQDVEDDDVGRALPDAVERRLAVEARHDVLLDETVAA